LRLNAGVFMKIVIAYDGSIQAGTALDDLQWAGLPSNTQAIVLSVVEEGIPAPRGDGSVEARFAHGQVAIAERWAEEGCNRLTGHFPQWDIQMETRLGGAATVILDKACAWPADLIVVGTHSRSRLPRVLLGSVSLKLVREAPCSVRVGRASKHEGPIRLLIANDGSFEAAAAVEEVCRRAWPPGTEIQILGVHEVPVAVNGGLIAIGRESYRHVDEQERLWLKHAGERSLEKLRQAGLHASSAIEEGDPKDALVEAAKNWNADAIFMGARGMGRVERLLLGSVSSATVTHAPCTVEVVRGLQPVG
jgi:nucleotide-binding universal stress UspA family protein